MNALARLSNPLPISQRELEEDYTLEFHRRARRSSWHAILDWQDGSLAQEAADGLLDPDKWSVEP